MIARSVVTVLVVALALAGLGGPVAGEERDYADSLCAPDPAGDAFVMGDDGEEIPIDEPRADIRELCADYPDADELTLRLRTQQLTAPATDPGWTGGDAASATRVMWFLNLGEGYRFVVTLDHDGTRPGVTVSELVDGEEVERCPRTAAAGTDDDGWLAAQIDPSACLDGPDHVTVAAVMAYDTDPGDPDAPVALDDADEMLSVGRDGAPTVRATDRLAGANRLGTAVAISAHRYPDGAPVVHLARADDFPDALAAGSLGATRGTDGPILLVPSCGAVPRVVLDEVARLQPASVSALGGQSAVCEEVLQAVAAAGRDGGSARPTQRYADPAAPNRFGTAVTISRRAFPDGAAEVYLATGEAFPDALAAGSLRQGPLLLVPSCGTLPGVVEDELARLDPGRILALGGQGAVCDAVLEQAARAGGGEPTRTGRLRGPSRVATAAAIATYSFPGGAAEVYLARADAFPDALAAGTLARGPILLVPSCGDLPPEVAGVVRRLAPDRVLALGGAVAVCEQMLRHAANVR